MSSMTLVRRIAASPDTVFDLVATAEGIAQWWGPDDGPVVLSEFDARVGGRFRLRFRMRDGSEHEVAGEVLEIARPTRLVTTWNWIENEGEAASRLEIALNAVDGGCELVFTHALLPDEATARGHEKGWSGSLGKLQRAVDARAIRVVHEAWVAAVNAADIDSLLPMMAEDSVFVSPGEPPLLRDGFPAKFTDGHRRFLLHCASELREIVVGGDSAHTLCHDTLAAVPRDGGETMRLSGHRLSVYRRQPDGRWLLARDAHTLVPVSP
jgi:uncharacterized protein (TIGR02246 family)